MADDKDREGVSAVTLFSVVGQIFISMFLVLLAAGRPEGDSFRIFIMVYLLVMTGLYTGAMLWLRFRKKTPKGPGA